jgi:hypothetical protein
MNAPKLITATQAELDEILAAVKTALPDKQYRLLEAVLSTFVYVMQALRDTKTSLKRFQRMLFGASTESKANELGALGADGHVVHADAVSGAADAVTEATPTQAVAEAPPPPLKRGHGRNGAQAYGGAAVVEVALSEPVAGQAGAG